MDIFDEIRHSRLGIFDLFLSQTLPLSEAERDIIVERLPQKTQEVVNTQGLIYLTPQTIQNLVLPKNLRRDNQIAHYQGGLGQMEPQVVHYTYDSAKKAFTLPNARLSTEEETGRHTHTRRSLITQGNNSGDNYSSSDANSNRSQAGQSSPESISVHNSNTIRSPIFGMDLRLNDPNLELNDLDNNTNANMNMNMSRRSSSPIHNTDNVDDIRDKLAIRATHMLDANRNRLTDVEDNDGSSEGGGRNSPSLSGRRSDRSSVDANANANAGINGPPLPLEAILAADLQRPENQIIGSSLSSDDGNGIGNDRDNENKNNVGNNNPVEYLSGTNSSQSHNDDEKQVNYSSDDCTSPPRAHNNNNNNNNTKQVTFVPFGDTTKQNRHIHFTRILSGKISVMFL